MTNSNDVGISKYSKFYVDVPQTLVRNADVNENRIITSNGNYIVPNGKTGWNSFRVNISEDIGNNVENNKIFSYDSLKNNFDIYPSEGYDSMRKVEISPHILIKYLKYVDYDINQIRYAVMDMNDDSKFKFHPKHTILHENVPKTAIRMIFTIKDEPVIGRVWKIQYFYSPSRSIGYKYWSDYFYCDVPVDKKVKENASYLANGPPLWIFEDEYGTDYSVGNITYIADQKGDAIQVGIVPIFENTFLPYPTFDLAIPYLYTQDCNLFTPENLNPENGVKDIVYIE